MAEQTIDWREREQERTAAREARDEESRRDPAYPAFADGYAAFVGGRAAQVLYRLAKELKKHPVLRELVGDIAYELDTCFPIVAEWPDVKPRLEEDHPSHWSVTQEYERLLGAVLSRSALGSGNEAVAIAEVLQQAARLEDLWHRTENAEGDEQGRLVISATHAESSFRGSVLSMIRDGKVDPRAAAEAAMRTDGQGIDLDRAEHPDLIEPPDDEERSALAAMLKASERVAEAVPPFAPWGSAAAGIARELRIDLGVSDPRAADSTEEAS